MKHYLVIGAGILGASTAYHLARSGQNVTIIDREDAGQATDAAAGIICPWLSQRRNKAWYALAKGGAAHYQTLIEELKEDGETDTGYKRVGAISLHSDEGKLLQMEERALQRREDAAEIGKIKQLSQDETVRLFPALTHDYRSVFISGAARVDGRALRNALINGAVKHGATLVKGSAELKQDVHSTLSVKVGEQQFEADGVIVTAGAWADQLLAPLGIRLLLSAQKAQIVHLQQEQDETDSWPVVMPPNDQYILAFDKGRVVVGATHENDKAFDQRVTAGGLNEVFDKALSIAPGLSESTFVEARVGFRPFTPGFLPVIGQVPGYENLFLANGLGASGLTAGPFLGAQLAKLAAGEEVDIDLDLYDVAKAIES
ncbi:D-amino-acid dehydrogenase [Bacillus ectoiniformans]|uniref:NAD(P)/FAD-dependent oxidoreductase n=1 Tax=Bacillus ectoiniformans TaxID=1494429 RepID=UPI00195907D5|nr:FAD-dependent oxidoreductase [Bacillus ectoiniformans]MBM7648212.1 D-amino-acid dehydrogenase [Bacillus ectoiniformans]